MAEPTGAVFTVRVNWRGKLMLATACLVCWGAAILLRLGVRLDVDGLQERTLSEFYRRKDWFDVSGPRSSVEGK